MGSTCNCGSEFAYSFHRLSCFDCGSTCCPGCAIALESVSYCRSCAETLLGASTVRAGAPFELR
jgi:hypothetical protein